ALGVRLDPVDHVDPLASPLLHERGNQLRRVLPVAVHHDVAVRPDGFEAGQDGRFLAEVARQPTAADVARRARVELLDGLPGVVPRPGVDATDDVLQAELPPYA